MDKRVARWHEPNVDPTLGDSALDDSITDTVSFGGHPGRLVERQRVAVLSASDFGPHVVPR